VCGGSYPVNQLQQWLVCGPLQPLAAIPLIKAQVSEALQEFLPMDSQRGGD
jgi:CPA2 family monovalent cation:H+ antiporter-2